MSLKLREKFSDRDFDLNPLTRQETQVTFDYEHPDEVDFHAQQSPNAGGALDSAKIVQKALETNMLHHTVNASARYIDASQITDFRQAMSDVARADETFNLMRDSLTPEQLKKFDKEFSTKREFLEFIATADNADKLREMGLIKALKVVADDTKTANPEGSPAPKGAQETPQV